MPGERVVSADRASEELRREGSELRGGLQVRRDLSSQVVIKHFASRCLDGRRPELVKHRNTRHAANEMLSFLREMMGRMI